MGTSDVREVQSGADGAIDHHGETLPELSKSASRIDISKIENARRVAKKQGDHPGIGWFYDLMMGFASRAFKGQFRTIEITGLEHISEEAGMLTVAWHTNGLIDPMCISVTQSKRLVFGGRHDLVTRPILGPIASRMGTQPVIRQAELVRGGASEEAAGRINGKTMLTIADCIAHGQASALFPEGTSHLDSKMKRLRTGPMRSVIAANSIAKERDLPEPHLLPVGLHFRTSFHFGTDVWIEYREPIHLSEFTHSPGDRTKLISGEWVEAPVESVNTLRELVYQRLSEITPDSDTWDEHRTWHTLGHIEAQIVKKPLQTWKDEVLAARNIRDRIRNGESKLLDSIPAAERISQSLHEVGLDGRSISSEGLRKPKITEKTAILPAILLALMAAPLTIYSSGLMILTAKILGDKTDEGLDARTTYHILLGLLGPILIWPFAVIILGAFAYYLLVVVGYFGTLSLIHVMVIILISPFCFHLSNRVALKGWHFYVIYRDARRLTIFSKSENGANIESDVKKLLVVLK